MIVDDRLMHIKRYVEKRTGFEDIGTKNRDSCFVFARMVYYKLCSKYVKSTKTRCGRLVNKDHACMIHALKQIKHLPYSYSKLIDEFDDSLLKKVVKTDLDTYELLVESEARVKYLEAKVVKMEGQFINLTGNDMTAGLVDLMDNLTFEEGLNIKHRIKAIIKMETNKRNYERRSIKPVSAS